MSEKKLDSCLKNEKVYIQYIRRNNTIYEKLGNPASGGMHENSKTFLTVPIDPVDGTFKRILTPEEFDFLQSVTDVDISYSNKEFWKNMGQVLKKEGTYYDLSNPMGYIGYKVIEAWANPAIVGSDRTIICSDISQVDRRKYYKFVIVKPEQEAKAKRLNAGKKSTAYIKLGSYENSPEILAYLVYAVTPDNRLVNDYEEVDDMIALLQEVIDTNPAAFVTRVEDPMLKSKALILHGRVTGVIRTVDKDLWYESIKLADKDDQATMENAADFLARPINQELRLKIEAGIKDKEKAK